MEIKNILIGALVVIIFFSFFAYYGSEKSDNVVSDDDNNNNNNDGNFQVKNVEGGNDDLDNAGDVSGDEIVFDLFKEENISFESLDNLLLELDSRRVLNVDVSKSVCEDEDEGGDFFEKGAMKFCLDSSDENCIYQEDYCIDDNILLEYYCDDIEKFKSSEMYCETGCYDGACIEFVSNEEEELQEKIDEDFLIIESKNNIISYGFTEEFFDEHFKLVEYNEFGVQNGGYIMWELEVGNFITNVVDSVAYLNVGGDLNYLHTIPFSQEVVIEDLNDILTRQEAQSLISDCIENIDEVETQLNLQGPDIGFFYVAKEKLECTENDDLGVPCREYRNGVVNLVTGEVVVCEE